ncbi:universal stress protein UspA-like protein [Candidatus Nitrososphaera evergladensis SR1]|uniref:Universal stress protein UspA-like protein n=1 Tax=Candidatus Nitrososphaera evergladensis SR1 TaxID=1459636 RepID=A0A075MQ29_9ARCH|nr:universal stress protein [Candidatus Nitrososphaera evergladensis]AIF82972.1 universal stress protein UspA-like protein [Candidatus Nitrososphaera evergladensis SR1]
MYRKILVPYEGSQFSERAAEHAAYLAKLSGAKVTFLTVTALPSLIYTYNEAVNAAISEAAELLIMSSESPVVRSLKSRVEKCKKRGIDAKLVHTVGDPAMLVLETARKEGTDLIVLGSKGLKGVSKLKVFGSVARKVTELLVCPVLLVH